MISQFFRNNTAVLFFFLSLCFTCNNVEVDCWNEVCLQLCTDGPEIKGQKTYCPNVFMTKAILSQSFGLSHSLISQTRTELQCGFGTVLIAEQDSPLKHALPLKACHKTRIGLMRQYVFQPTHGKNVFTANWTSLHRRKQNLGEKQSVSERTLPQTPWRISTWI